jgi:hypothetical protein
LVERELNAFGQRLYEALARARTAGVMLDDSDLRALLLPAAADQAVMLRALRPRSITLAEDERALLSQASYVGICLQQGRVEGKAGLLGLRHAGFVFERALLVGREPGGERVASWVEGRFVHTESGFVVLGFERVEAPRRDHADLELAVCELRAGSFDHNP